VKYLVMLRGDLPESQRKIYVEANDVNVDTCEVADSNFTYCSCTAHWYNFTDEDSITVAAFPFNDVAYVKGE
jgi:hypothetical protein